MAISISQIADGPKLGFAVAKYDYIHSLPLQILWDIPSPHLNATANAKTGDEAVPTLAPIALTA
jgi:hypothetical protein